MKFQNWYYETGDSHSWNDQDKHEKHVDIFSMSHTGDWWYQKKAQFTLSPAMLLKTAVWDLNILVPMQQSRSALSCKNVTRTVLCKLCVMHCCNRVQALSTWRKKDNGENGCSYSSQDKKSSESNQLQQILIMRKLGFQQRDNFTCIGCQQTGNLYGMPRPKFILGLGIPWYSIPWYFMSTDIQIIRI